MMNSDIGDISVGVSHTERHKIGEHIGTISVKNRPMFSV